MKEKIIKILYDDCYISNGRKLLDEIYFEDAADEIIKLIKSEIYTNTDYLAESIFNHFK